MGKTLHLLSSSIKLCKSTKPPYVAVSQVQSIVVRKTWSHSTFLDDICADIPSKNIDKAMELKEECVNSFARSYFDLVWLTALEHHINTGKARPENPPMRHMPAVYQVEDAGYLFSNQNSDRASANRPCKEIGFVYKVLRLDILSFTSNLR